MLLRCPRAAADAGGELLLTDGLLALLPAGLAAAVRGSRLAQSATSRERSFYVWLVLDCIDSVFEGSYDNS